MFWLRGGDASVEPSLLPRGLAPPALSLDKLKGGGVGGMRDGAVRNPAARHLRGAPRRSPFALNFDGLSGPSALMLAAEEGCKVRAVHRPRIARSSDAI